jgi:hypothetical protein
MGGLCLTGASGTMQYRKDGTLLFDFDALNAIVRDGAIEELPDASEFSEPDGAPLIPAQESKFNEQGDWTTSGAGSLTVEDHVGNFSAAWAAPLLTVPGTQTTNEDTAKPITGISITDPDSAAVTITLSVTQGVLSLAQTTGLTFTVGDGTSDAAMSFSGSPANVNAALATVTFTPSANYNGSATLSIEVEDEQEATDSDTVSITITAVNDGPILTVPGTQSATEDTAKAISGISVSDIDSATLTVTLGTSHGSFSLAQTTGLTFTVGDGTNDGAMSFSGSVANVNAALATVTYNPTPNYFGTDALDVGVSDGSLSASDSITINIAAVNDAPVLTVPGTQSTNEDTPKAITGTSVGDVDSTNVEVTVAATHGVISLATTAGLNFTAGDGTNDVTQTFNGSLANVNTALATLTFSPTLNYYGAAVISIDVSDSALSDSDTITVNIAAVNDAPVLTVPGTQSMNEDETKGITGISVADVDTATISVTLDVDEGTLTLAQTTGLTFTVGDGTTDTGMAFSGSLANVNAALATVTYAPAPDYFGSDTLHIEITDGTLTDSDDVTISIADVPDGPVVTVPCAQSTNEDTNKAITGVSITSATSPITVRLQCSPVGGMQLNGSVTGLTFTDGANGDDDFTVEGSTSNVNAALADLYWQVGGSNPATNFTGTVTITITADDGTLDDEETIALTVVGVNDAPALSVPGLQLVPTNTSYTNIQDISIADVDSANVVVTVEVSHGLLQISGHADWSITDGANFSPYMEITGVRATMNAELFPAFRYQPDEDYEGGDTLVITVDDGAGGSDAENVSIQVGTISSRSFYLTVLNSYLFPGFNQSVQFDVTGDFNGTIGPFALDSGGVRKTPAALAAEVKTALNGLGYSYVLGYGGESGGGDQYLITCTILGTCNVWTNPPTASSQQLGPTLNLLETVTEQGVADVTGSPGSVSIEAIGESDITTDIYGNSVTLDVGGSFASATPGGGWTFTGNTGTVGYFTATTNGVVTASKSSGAGTVTLVASGAADVPGSGEEHRIQSRRGVTEAGPASGEWQPASGSMSVAYNADSGTIAAAVGTGFGGYSVGGNSGTLPNVYLRCSVNGDMSDTALSPNAGTLQGTPITVTPV